MRIAFAKCNKRKKGLKKTRIMINTSGKVSEADRIMRVTIAEPV